MPLKEFFHFAIITTKSIIKNFNGVIWLSFSSGTEPSFPPWGKLKRGKTNNFNRKVAKGLPNE